MTNTVFNNLFWKFLERCGAQGVSFIVSIILARLLEPSIYGVISLVLIITSIMQTFVDSGFGNALVQKKNPDDLDFSTIFYFNIVMCILMYVILFFTAPFISDFYKIKDLTPVIRVLGIVILISGVRSIQQSYVSKHLMFKKFFYSTLGGTIGAAVIGIWMAFNGFGIWALVAQQIFNTFFGTVILWFTVKWRPKPMFSFKRLKSLFTYGWKLLASGLLDKIYQDLRQLIIGGMYTPSDLAFYNKGNQFPKLIVDNINSSIDSVLLPTMSNIQDKIENLKSITRRAIKTSTYLIVPLMTGLAVCSKTLIPLLLTEKWNPCIEYLVIFCFTMSFYPIHTANLNAIKAIGRSDIFLKLEIIKKAIGIAAILITMWISVRAMAYSLLVTTILSSFINAYPNKKLLNYSYVNQIADILPQITLSLIMGILIYPISYIALPSVLIILLQVVTGAVIYIAGSMIFKFESFYYLLSILKSFLKK